MALPLIGPLISAVVGGFKSWNDGRVQIKDAKIKAKVARYEAEAARAMKVVQGEIDWDMAAMENAKTSWKDEYLVFLLSLPFIGSFIPVVQDYVQIGWQYVSQAPYWYQLSFVGVIAASFGLRWLFKGRITKAVTP